jgi:type II secretory pathway pseudopilin PulG
VLRLNASTPLRPAWPSKITSEDERGWRSCKGTSIIEMLIVIAMIGVVAAAAIPQLISAQRLVRSAAIPRQMMAEMRMARQQAMTQRQAYTVQYDDVNKQLVIINHKAWGIGLLTAPGYPDTAGSVRERVVPFSGSGVKPAEIIYGIPGVLPTSAKGALDDGVALTGLNNNQLNVTFQPSGSVLDQTGSPVNQALFLYNSQAPTDTPFAISILGAAGRLKVWRYSSIANKYVE